MMSHDLHLHNPDGFSIPHVDHDRRLKDEYRHLDRGFHIKRSQLYDLTLNK